MLTYTITLQSSLQRDGTAKRSLMLIYFYWIPKSKILQRPQKRVKTNEKQGQILIVNCTSIYQLIQIYTFLCHHLFEIFFFFILKDSTEFTKEFL